MTDDLFFDTDCLSAFLWIGNTNILRVLYGGKIVLPEPVYRELSNPAIPHIKQRVDRLLESKDASVKFIRTGTKEYGLYELLIQGKKGGKGIGRGEAGAIALAQVYHGILASNNYKDITPYIERFQLKHIDTGQILAEALKKGILTKTDGDHIWTQMLAKKRMLPAETFSAYLLKDSVQPQAF